MESTSACPPDASFEHLAQSIDSDSSGMVHGLDDRPPFQVALLVALQHVCAVFVPIVTPGLLIAEALGLNAELTSYMTGMALLIAGIGTFLQARRFGPIGSGLLAVQGTSFAFVTPMLGIVSTSISAGKTPEQTLSLIMGLCLVGALIPIILSRFLHLMRRVFTPLVTGTAVLLIGLSLIKIGMFQMAGGASAVAIAQANPESSLAFGSLQNWSLAFLVFTIVGICSASPNRYLRMGSVMVGLLIGSFAASLMGMVNFSTFASLPMMTVPWPLRFGFSFDLTSFLGFAIVYIVLTLEVAGDITATCRISGEPIEGTQYIQRLKGGVLGDGVNSLMAAIVGTFPIVTPAQNNGIIQLTGVCSRYVGYFIAAILVGLGIFPLVGGAFLAIPTAVFGGAMMPVFGTVAVAGMNILREIKMDDRTLAILAISLAAGLGVTFLPETLEHLPAWLRSLLESGISTGSICALALNLLLPKSPVMINRSNRSNNGA